MDEAGNANSNQASVSSRNGKLVSGDTKPYIRSRFLASSEPGNSWVRFSPDGEILVFNVLYANGESRMFSFSWNVEKQAREIKYASGRKRMLPAFVRPVNDPASIVYSVDASDDAHLFQSSIDGHSERQITKDASSRDLYPDVHDNLVVFERSRKELSEIWSVDLGRPNAERPLFPCPYQSCRTPRFSNTGEHVAFTATVDGNEEIFLYAMETGVLTRLTFTVYDELTPDFSPDDDEIIHGIAREKQIDLWVLNIANKKSRKILDFSARDTFPDWHPSDATSLVFSSKISEKSAFLFLYQEIPVR